VSAGATCAGASAVLLGAGIWFPSGGRETERWVILASAAALMLVWSVALIIRRARTERVLLLGSSQFATKICEAVDAASDRRFKIAGIVDDAPTAERVSGYAPWVGTPDQLDGIVERIQPSRIVLTLCDRRGGRLPERALLQARLRGVRVEEGIQFYERVAGKLAIESLPPTSLILSGGFRRLELKREGFWWRSSRVVECIIASLALLALSPLLGLCALLIKIDSRGSIFFIQPRVGCGGRPFGLIKFRTMHEATGERTEWFRDNAHRVTRVGDWLRRFRLDELPQFINVLRGEMSFVGPRPHPVTNYQKFLKEIPYYHLREMVRPGITGWAQVKYGYANNLEEETEKMRFDIYYIKHRSLWLDARIAVETVVLLMFDRRSHQAAKSTKPSDSWPPGRVAPLG
jgi:exopolysaccharide biosynthesis polyprenyl glycosylphosphotransferase